MTFDPRHDYRFEIDTSTSGATIIAATSGKSILVTSLHYMVAGAVTVKWQSNTTDLTGAISYAATGGVALGWNQYGYFKTTAGEALKVALGSAVQLSGFGTYALV